jgi:hypothetical protein
VTWAWYSGGWDNAAGNIRGRGWTNGNRPGTCADSNHNPSAAYPYCADRLFQYHHQAFNYYAKYAEGAPGRSFLRDERDLLDQAAAGTLPAVSFVKPLGLHNEHPGYADVDSGERHLIDLVEALQRGPGWPRPRSSSPTTSRRLLGPRAAAGLSRRDPGVRAYASGSGDRRCSKIGVDHSSTILPDPRDDRAPWSVSPLAVETPPSRRCSLFGAAPRLDDFGEVCYKHTENRSWSS